MKNDKGNIITIILILIIILIIAGMYIWGANIYEEVFNDEKRIEVVNMFYEGSIEEEKENSLKVPEIVENPLEKMESTYKNENAMQVSSNSIGNELYNQLNKYSQKIYSGLKNNKENMKDGTYTVEFGETFSELLKQENGQELLKAYYQSAIEAFLYDNPEVFYLEPNKMYLNIKSTTYKKKITFDVYINSGNENNYYIDGIETKEQLQENIKNVEKVRDYVISNISGTPYDKIKQIHDYLVDSINYEVTISKNDIDNIYGALVKRECVCSGYAKTFKYLLNEAGINCVFARGAGTNSENITESHAWNYVEIDGIWYAVDVTWDDPIIMNGGRLTDKIRYEYFLKGSINFNKNHVEENRFTEYGQEFKYPEISEVDF